MTAHSSSFVLLTLFLLPGCKVVVQREPELTSRDSSAIEAVRSAYVRAWLADDTAGVLATLDSQAVLLPPGRLPVQGHREIRAFWWPEDGSHTTINPFDWKLEELSGTPHLAFSRGISTIVWRYQKDTVRVEHTTRNTNLTILGRGRDGRWRILRQMWGPPLPG
jgi:ketosteroid isomerase-like protein